MKKASPARRTGIFAAISFIVRHAPFLSIISWRRRGGCLTALALALFVSGVGLFFAGMKSDLLWRAMRKRLPGNVELTTEFRRYFETKHQVNKLVLLERRSVEEIIRNMTASYSLPGLAGAGFAGTATVAIRCPVFWTYYVDLKEQWEFKLTRESLEVTAPPIRIAPPSIDPGRIERRIEGGWMVFGKSGQLAALEKELQVTLRARAMRPENMAEVQQDCRQSLKTFLRGWLLNSPHQVQTIHIRFANQDAGEELRDGSL